jgi:hypothetical protein
MMLRCILKPKRLETQRSRKKKGMAAPKSASISSKLKSIGFTGASVGQGFAQSARLNPRLNSREKQLPRLVIFSPH